MTNRSVPLVIILGLITFGIYPLIWFHMTRGELLNNKVVEKMQSPWLVLIPFIGIIFYIIFIWQYSGAVEKVTNGKYSQVIALVLLLLLGGIGQGIIQAAYNEIGEVSGGGDPFSGKTA
jgi:hypothetical protein